MYRNEHEFVRGQKIKLVIIAVIAFILAVYFLAFYFSGAGAQ